MSSAQGGYPGPIDRTMPFSAYLLFGESEVDAFEAAVAHADEDEIVGALSLVTRYSYASQVELDAFLEGVEAAISHRTMCDVTDAVMARRDLR